MIRSLLLLYLLVATTGRRPNINEGSNTTAGGLHAEALPGSAGGFRRKHASAEETFNLRGNQNNFGALSWALVIDGKDAEKGKNAYDGAGFAKVLKEGLPFVLGSQNVDRLTPEHAEDIHKHCCDWGFRTKGHRPMGDFMAKCFKSMSCEAQLAAISDVPEDVIDVTWGGEESDGKRCPKNVQPAVFKTDTEPRKILHRLINEYGDSIAQVHDEEGKLHVLSKFLRNLSWLHAFMDGNGRFRTLLLQHEVRRLGLGSGVFMFNNNRDVFFTDHSTYMAKIKEGLEMAQGASESNPWLDGAKVQAHMKKFPPPGQGTCFELGDKGLGLGDHTQLAAV